MSIYEAVDNGDIYRGGFRIDTRVDNNTSVDIIGGAKKNLLQNKAVPFGIAMKRLKPHVNYECKNGDVLDNTLFEKLFHSVATLNSSVPKKNTTRKSKKSTKK
jgi:hypothetical protein